jgi:HD-like signal output (HDOD) protein
VARYGLDHAELGAEAAQRWGFAPDVVDAIAHHHDVGAVLTSPLAAHIMVGDQVANAMGYPAVPMLGNSDAEEAAAIVQSVAQGIMARAQWALSRDLPRIEALISTAGL